MNGIFPFAISPSGRIHAAGGDETLRGKIIQVLFTMPGERINLPEFGCGLFNLVFEPNNPILEATLEFTVGQALTRWLGEEIQVEQVEISSHEETIFVSIVYIKRQDRTRQALRVQFQ